MVVMLLLDAKDKTLDELMALVPEAEVLDLPDWLVNADPAAEHPTLYGDHPPLEWLTTIPEGFGPDSPPFIDELGRVCAVAWPYDRCHVGYTDAGLCVTLPPSPTANHMFHQGNTVTAEKVQVPTGFLGLHGHDQDPAHTVQQAQRYYNDPLQAGARGRIVETPEAAYFCGALKPGVTFSQVETIRGGALSGDWRWIPEIEAYDALGPCLVARPGLPTTFRADASGGPLGWELTYQVTQDQESGIIASVPTWVPRTTEEIQAMAGRRKIHIAGTNRKPVKALAEGMTYQSQRDALSEAAKEAFASADDQWLYLVDFDDAMMVFELEGDGEYRKMAVDYTISGMDVTFSGAPTEVMVQYVPAIGGSTSAPADEAAPVAASAAGSCSCKPKKPVQADGSDDADVRIAELETMVQDLMAKVARMEAVETPVDEIVNLPDEDGTGDQPAEEAAAA